MDEEYNWPPLECDQDILNNYLKELGVNEDIFFYELISFDQKLDSNLELLSALVLYQTDKNKGQMKIIKEK